MTDKVETAAKMEPAEKHGNEAAEQNGDTYSIGCVLEQIRAIQNQTGYLNEALTKLFAMSDGESGGPGSPGNIQGQAKAQAVADIVRCRETTNQQMLRLYEKMYDDLKPQKSADVMNILFESVAKLPPDKSQPMLQEILAEQLKRHW